MVKGFGILDSNMPSIMDVVVVLSVIFVLTSLVLWMISSQYRECTLIFLDGSKIIDVNCINSHGTTYCRNSSYRTYKSMTCVDKKQPK